MSQKERRMNPQLQLLVKAELERLLQAGFIERVEITDWVSPMVIVKKKNGKLKVCVDYQKLNACTQKDHFPLAFITMLLEDVGGHARYTFMNGYAWYNQIAIACIDYSFVQRAQDVIHHALGEVCMGGDAIRVV